MTERNDRLDIEAIYALSPMQQGMLFHSLYDQESGVYVEQLAATLHGSLDTSAFRQAWQQVMQRHAVLRTAFAWKRLDEMRQVVQRNFEPPLKVLDWRDYSLIAQEKHLQAFMEAERRQGFDLAKAPLMRLALMQLAADRHYFVWSHHHTLLDGWSLPIVLNEVLQFYEAFRQRHVLRLPAPRPYQDYIKWLDQQDEAETEGFWREQLRGFSTRTPLPGAHLPSRPQQIDRHRLELSLSTEATTQ